ncbi:MAG: GGDEF domain-containing protein [Dehalococcoidia bacterium]|nr:GGDEF domain-containing protein [Dehalococcoidia bacterium]
MFPLIPVAGRPREESRGVAWVPIALRLLTIAWGGTILAALLDEFGVVPHLPFLIAIGMTGLLVAAIFVLTRDEREAQLAGAGDEEADGEHDLLTDLPTFNHFARRLNDEFTRSRRMGRNVSVVLVDVNNLTAVNREYGVRAGDAVLRHVARTIDATKRYSDVVARLGDDEFGVLLLETGAEGIEAFVERLEDRLARESAMTQVNGRDVSLWAGVCSGSVTATPEMTHADALLEAAMADLNRAKQDRERRRRMWLSA